MKNNQNKIIFNLEEVSCVVDKIRAQKKKIVMTQGSFDMIHVGHARYLVEAKKYGDVLIVGTDSDNKIRQRKGPGRPVVPQDERLEMLTYLPVDYVVLKHSQDPKWGLIKVVKPDVLVIIKENYSKKEIEKIKEYCGEVKILPRMATTSTSAKLREVQIGAAQEIQQTLSKKLISSLEEAVRELRGES